MFEFEEKKDQGAQIRVIGVGGGGCNAVSYMYEQGMDGAVLIAANTDAQHLETVKAHVKIQLGKNLTKGLGVGGDPEKGRQATEESEQEIRRYLKGADLVFVTAGMGGGTGTGGAPVIAAYARQENAVTVGVVTRPFTFEGTQRRGKAEKGITELKGNVDTYVVIPNDRLLTKEHRVLAAPEAFHLADQVLYNAVSAIVDMVTRAGYVNVDFADVRAALQNGGPTLFGLGVGEGERRVETAVSRAIHNPLLEGISLRGARSILVNITHGPDFQMQEMEEIMERIHDQVISGTGADPQIIFGMVLEESWENRIQVTLIATGVKERMPSQEETEQAEDIEPVDEEKLYTPAWRRDRRSSFLRRYAEPEKEEER